MKGDMISKRKSLSQEVKARKCILKDTEGTEQEGFLWYPKEFGVDPGQRAARRTWVRQRHTYYVLEKMISLAIRKIYQS